MDLVACFSCEIWQHCLGVDYTTSTAALDCREEEEEEEEEEEDVLWPGTG